MTSGNSSLPASSRCALEHDHCNRLRVVRDVALSRVFLTSHAALRSKRHSDYPDVGRHDRCGALYGCHELGIGAAGAIRVVIQLSGTRVVNNAVVGIVAAGGACRRIEARITGGKVSGAAERGEGT